jgi:FLYWCH zinc finger domain
MEYIFSQRGHPLLVVNNFLYRKNRGNYWRCIRCSKYQCKSRLILNSNGQPPTCIQSHTHGPETDKIRWGRSMLASLPRSRSMMRRQQKEVYARQPHCNVDYVLLEEEVKSEK